MDSNYNNDTNHNETLFVGDLASNVTEEDISNVFNKYGTIVDIRMKSILEDGHSRAVYCFLQYSNNEEANRALVSMNNTMLKGRKLRIGWATPVIRDNRANHSNSAIVTSQVLVNFVSTNVEKDVTEELLYSVFINYGNVVDVSIKSRKCDHLGITGYGFVHFPDSKEGTTVALTLIYKQHKIVVDDYVTLYCKMSESLHYNLYGYGLKEGKSTYNTDEPTALYNSGSNNFLLQPTNNLGVSPMSFPPRYSTIAPVQIPFQPYYNPLYNNNIVNAGFLLQNQVMYNQNMAQLLLGNNLIPSPQPFISISRNSSSEDYYSGNDNTGNNGNDARQYNSNRYYKVDNHTDNDMNYDDNDNSRCSSTSDDHNNNNIDNEDNSKTTVINSDATADASCNSNIHNTTANTIDLLNVELNDMKIKEKNYIKKINELQEIINDA